MQLSNKTYFDAMALGNVMKICIIVLQCFWKTVARSPNATHECWPLPHRFIPSLGLPCWHWETSFRNLPYFFAIYGTLIFTTYCQPIRLALNRHVSDYNIRVSLRNRSRLISLATDVCRCGLGCEPHGFSNVYIVVITDDTCFQPQLTSNRYQ